MKFAMSGPVMSFDFQQDWIDVTSERSTPNERWRFTDENGHEHYYDHGYPTLELVVDASHWCDGSEGWAHHDPHEQIDEAHYECKTCRVTIEPAMDPPYTPKHIPGQQTTTVKAVQSNGRVIEFSPTQDEIERIRASADDHPSMQALVDAVPDERIYRWAFGDLNNG